MRLFQRRHARILMSRRNAAVYIDGRYLHVDAKLSTKSKRDREIARDLAEEILTEVGLTTAGFDRLKQLRHDQAIEAPTPSDNVQHAESG